MKSINKSILGKQIAYGYGIAFSTILIISGSMLICYATSSILYNYDTMVEIKGQYTNKTYLEENRVPPAEAKYMISLYERAYDRSCQDGRTFILAGLGLFILAGTIAYIPFSLYKQYRKEMFMENKQNDQ